MRLTPALSSIQPIIVIRPKMAFFGLKSVYTNVHFFLSKTPSLNCLKMHLNEVLRSIFMWEKFGPVHPLKNLDTYINFGHFSVSFGQFWVI